MQESELFISSSKQCADSNSGVHQMLCSLSDRCACFKNRQSYIAAWLLIREFSVCAIPSIDMD
jgi:hypothetical protein